MRLYLAVAVLMLALVAYAEAQDDTIEQRFTKFSERMTEIGKSVAEKAKTALDDFQNSEVVVRTGNWFQEQYEKLSSRLGSGSN